MSAKSTAKKPASRTDFARLRRMKDADIDFSDNPPTTAAFWEEAEIVHPGPKEQISMRLDQDVLAWFRGQGQGYQSRMNAVLRAYVQAHKKRTRRSPTLLGRARG